MLFHEYHLHVGIYSIIPQYDIFTDVSREQNKCTIEKKYPLPHMQVRFPKEWSILTLFNLHD